MDLFTSTLTGDAKSVHDALRAMTSPDAPDYVIDIVAVEKLRTGRYRAHLVVFDGQQEIVEVGISKGPWGDWGYSMAWQDTGHDPFYFHRRSGTWKRDRVAA